jgi:hypothetical protein
MIQRATFKVPGSSMMTDGRVLGASRLPSSKDELHLPCGLWMNRCLAQSTEAVVGQREREAVGK